jgi:hypothetical protein
MLRFKALDLEDKDIFKTYLKDYKFKTYEYSFSTLYLWRRLCNVEYAVFKDAIIIKKYEEGKGAYFMEPLFKNKNSIKEIMEELKDYKRMNGHKNLLRDIEEGFLRELKELYTDSILYREDINNYDYIYDASRLMTLSGNKLHSKKNHFNQFVNTYKYDIKDISEPGVAEECIDFSYRWTDTKEDSHKHLAYEKEGIRDILVNQRLLDIVGMALYIGEKIVGFSIGERINKDMAIIHIEKADPFYKGAYAFINKTFIELYFKDSKLINREEDLGIEGLRKAKESYHPLKLEKKYIVDL